MVYETIEVSPLTGRIGAEIFGIDLTQPLSNRQLEEIHDSFTEHQVIFFRDQKIDHESHQRLALHFGELIAPFGSSVPGYPGIGRNHTDENSDHVAGDMWHTDHSCDEIPPMGTILYMHTVPPNGGDTLFASMYAAYDALSDRMKAHLEGLTAEHDGPQVYARYYGREKTTGKYPINSHPVVAVHPASKKKYLYVNEQYTTRINELSPRESSTLLRYLFEHCADAAFHVRFRWRPHSIAFWDNRCTQHYAIWDYFPQKRSGFKVVISGQKLIMA